MRGLPQRQFHWSAIRLPCGKIPDRFLRLLRQIDLAFPESQQQLVGGRSTSSTSSASSKNGVGHGFPDPNAGYLADVVVQAFEMLHVQGGINIDAGIEQFLDVLPAFRMARSGALVCASSSTRMIDGRRFKAASRSNSRSTVLR